MFQPNPADEWNSMFDWKPEYSVQMPEIDAQHQRLFKLAAKLYDALNQGKGYAVMEQLLASLVDYTKVHFASEEKLMARHAFPGSGAHKQEHDKLTAQVLDLQKRFRAGNTSLSIEVMLFLKNWLQQHIAGSDQKYSAYIRGKLAA